MSIPEVVYFTKGLISGDERVLEEVYSRFFPKIKSYILTNRGEIKDAEDVFHNGLIQLYIRLKKRELVISSSFESYLFIVCKNLWIRELNKKKVKRDNVIDINYEEKDMVFALLEQEQWELYIEKFQLLSEKCRAILTLLFNKASYEEIVVTFSYTSKTVARQRVFKCKAKLAKMIKEDIRFSKLKER